MKKKTSSSPGKDRTIREKRSRLRNMETRIVPSRKALFVQRKSAFIPECSEPSSYGKTFFPQQRTSSTEADSFSFRGPEEEHLLLELQDYPLPNEASPFLRRIFQKKNAQQSQEPKERPLGTQDLPRLGKEVPVFFWRRLVFQKPKHPREHCEDRIALCSIGYISLNYRKGSAGEFDI